MKRYTLILIALALLTSCEKEINFKGQIEDPMIYVECVVDKFAAGDTIYARIGHTTSILEKLDTNSLSDSQITLLLNGNPIEINFRNDLNRHFFVLPCDLNEGDTLLLTVEHPDYKTVSSELVLPCNITPDVINCTIVDKSINVTVRMNGNLPKPKQLMCQFTFDLTATTQYHEQQDTLIRNFDTFLSSDPIFISRIDDFPFDDIFDDEPDPSIKAEKRYYSPTDININELTALPYEFTVRFTFDDFFLFIPEQLTIGIANINYEAYLHDYTRRKAQEVEYNPFAEAVCTYSNINNGAGCFKVIRSEVTTISDFE